MSAPNAFLERVPTMRELYSYVVKRVCHKWEELGVCLELDRDGAKLAAIRKSFIQLGVETCCSHLFMKWLKEGRKEVVNWKTIFTCLEDIGCNGVVKEIKAKLDGKCVFSIDLIWYEHNVNTYRKRGRSRFVVGGYNSYSPASQPACLSRAAQEIPPQTSH